MTRPFSSVPSETAAAPRPEPHRWAGADERTGIQSVEVGYALLAVLAQAQGAQMLRDLAAAAHMSAAKAHRYLVSFQRLGLVVQDAASGHYDLGPAALRLGLAALARQDAVALARERVAALLAETGHTVAIAVWGNHGPTIVHWAQAPLAVPVSLRLGDVMPLLTSATGRCFAAHAGPLAERMAPLWQDELKRLQRVPGLQSRSDVPLTPQAVQHLFTEVRQRGMARVVDTLLPGVAGLCAPVFDADGRMALGLVVLGSAATFDAAWGGAVEQSLRRMATQLSLDLGFKVT